MTEAHATVLRHRLDFQTQNPQFVHHPGHAVRHHTQVFGTNKHTGGLCQLRQFLHRLGIPELVVSTIEVVIVESIEVGLLPVIELLIRLLILHGNTWMPSVIALVVNKEQAVVKLYAIGLNLLLAHAEGWRELPHQSGLIRYGDLPDTEEAQHVVDTVGIEIFGHLTEAAHPPRTAVLQHLVPVVGGEAPVLTISRERIGWRSSLTVQVEVFRFYPGLHTITADADGDVALQDDTLLTGMLMGSTHLLVEVELYKIPEGYFLIEFRGRFCHGLTLLGWQLMVVGPLLESCRAIKVTIVTEGSIGHQPLLVLLEEPFERLTLQHLTTLLGVDLTQIVHLCSKHTLVVDLWQLIQFLTQLLKSCALSLVLNGRQLTEISVLRMQGIDADGVVGIGVLPRPCHVRIVDGQHLQNPLLCLVTPVDHQLQVTKVAHAEAPFCTQ